MTDHSTARDGSPTPDHQTSSTNPSPPLQVPVPASLEERARTDPHRPQFHFVSPGGWLNDPNGVGQWNGRYHLFYQYNPAAAVHADIHWGHASSEDLVHWTDEPIALAPSPGPDADGCWSGVLVDDRGAPTLVYSGNRDGVGQRACLAVGDPDLRHWRKDPANPVIADLPSDLDLTEFRDHCVWRSDDEWLQLIGSGIRGVGGTALLYRSHDLRSWRYVGPILVGDSHDTDVWTGSVWECVDLFRLGSTGDAAPDVLLMSVWDADVTHYGVYQTGRFDGERFQLRQKHLLDYGLNYFYAAQSFDDDQGRRVLFGWIQEGRPIPDQVDAGWSGVMSLPRHASLSPDGHLRQRPVDEITRLRGAHHRLEALTLRPGQTHALADIAGNQLDIEMTVSLPADATVELSILATPDRTEQTVVQLRHGEGQTVSLALDRTSSSLNAGVDIRPLAGTITDGAPTVTLRVVIDHSVVEIFANGLPLTARVYPTRADAQHLHLTAHGSSVTVESVDAWQMNGIWADSPRSGEDVERRG